MPDWLTEIKARAEADLQVKLDRMAAAKLPPRDFYLGAYNKESVAEVRALPATPGNVIPFPRKP